MQRFIKMKRMALRNGLPFIFHIKLLIRMIRSIKHFIKAKFFENEFLRCWLKKKINYSFHDALQKA